MQQCAQVREETNTQGIYEVHKCNKQQCASAKTNAHVNSYETNMAKMKYQKQKSRAMSNAQQAGTVQLN